MFFVEAPAAEAVKRKIAAGGEDASEATPAEESEIPEKKAKIDETAEVVESTNGTEEIEA